MVSQIRVLALAISIVLPSYAAHAMGLPPTPVNVVDGGQSSSAYQNPAQDALAALRAQQEMDRMQQLIAQQQSFSTLNQDIQRNRAGTSIDVTRQINNLLNQ